MQSTLMDACDKCGAGCVGKLYKEEVLCDACYEKAVKEEGEKK